MPCAPAAPPTRFDGSQDEGAGTGTGRPAYDRRMADVRTYDPSEGNPIAQALRAAMGEPVRPVTPGEKPPAAPAPAANSWVSLKVVKEG